MATLILNCNETIDEVSKFIDVSKIDVIIKNDGPTTEIIKSPFKKLEI